MFTYYLLQFRLWNSLSLSIRSPSTLHSSQTILCHPSCNHKNTSWKIVCCCCCCFVCYAGPAVSGTICLKRSATLILPPLLKPPSRRTGSITISKLSFFTAVPIPPSDVCVCTCACVCMGVGAVRVIVKRPALPPCALDGRSRNPLYYYYY